MTVGAVPNPIPPSVTIYFITPLDDVLIEQVAAAPVPPPPVNVIVGASVYPKPALVINIFSTDVTFALEVVNATAVAVDHSNHLVMYLLKLKVHLRNQNRHYSRKFH